jgi:hypothetical protein
LFSEKLRLSVAAHLPASKLELFPIGEALGRKSTWPAVTVLKKIDVLKFARITL